MLHMQWKDLIGKQSKRRMPFPQSEKYSEEDFCFRFVKSVLSWQWLSLIWGMEEIKSAVLVLWNKKEPWGKVSEQLHLSYRFYRRSEKSKQENLSSQRLTWTSPSGLGDSAPHHAEAGAGQGGAHLAREEPTCELFSIHPLSSTPNRLWEMNPQAHTASLLSQESGSAFSVQGPGESRTDRPPHLRFQYLQTDLGGGRNCSSLQLTKPQEPFPKSLMHTTSTFCGLGAGGHCPWPAAL